MHGAPPFNPLLIPPHPSSPHLFFLLFHLLLLLFLLLITESMEGPYELVGSQEEI